ncbi:MAG: response regulator [Chloroflexi bacterium]|nr:response regulator [Chloroflexota bacterium]MBP8055884.1 response regulator [Chloroflexota bacterium]
MARVLIIEDNPANLELMTYLLQAFGHLPIAAADGTTGLRIVQQDQVDLIICDIQLPEIDGYEVVRQLKSTPTLQAIPIIAVTAYAMVGDRDKMLAAGFDGYMSKPITPETFVTQIEKILAQVGNYRPQDNDVV